MSDVEYDKKVQEAQDLQNKWYLDMQKRMSPEWSPWTDMGYVAERYSPWPFDPLVRRERQTIDPTGKLDAKRWADFDAQRARVQQGKLPESGWTKMVLHAQQFAPK